MFRFTLKNDRLGTLSLKHPPLQWNDLSFTYERDKKYHGIAPKVAFEAEFVKEGKDYILQAFNRDSIEAVVTLEVERYNVNTFEYELIYTGRLDFTNFHEDTGGDNGHAVTVGVEQSGYARQFLNLDDIEINLQKLESLNGKLIPAFSKETESILLHSKKIIKRYEAVVDPFDPNLPVEYYIASMVVNTKPMIQKHWATLSFGFENVIVNELNATPSISQFNFITPPDIRTLSEHLEVSEQGPYRIDINLQGWVKALDDWETYGIPQGKGDIKEAEFRILYQINTNPATELFYYHKNNVQGDFYTDIQITQTFYENFVPGDRVYLYGEIQILDSSPFLPTSDYEFQFEALLHAGSYLKITGDTQTPATYGRGILAHEAFSRIVQSTSDMQAEFRSDFFGRTDSQPVTYPTDGPGSLLWISNGFQIRNFPLSNKPVFTSFRTLFDSLDAIYCLGVGIELDNGKEVLRVEPRDYFYKSEVVLRLGCVSKFKRSVAIDYFYNQAEFGYEQWQSEQINGLEEFNARQTVTLPLTQIKSKYSALCNYITSGYVLESTRREQYVDSNTKDGQRDNQNFLVCLLRDGGNLVTERNQQALVLQNVISPDTVYNVRLSPARNKRRHASQLKAGLLNRATQQVKFNNGEGNYLLRSQLIGEDSVMVENENLTVADLPDPAFIPEHYDLEAPFTYAQQQAFEADPYGLVEFEDAKGEIHRGYVVSVKTKPTEQSGEFKLLRALNG